MREVDAGQLNAARTDVLPHVRFRPVGNGEHADVFARQLAAVVQVPQLRALAARIPAAERIAHRKHALLRAGTLLITAGTTEHRVIANLSDGLYQRHRLQGVARTVRALSQITPIDPVLHVRHAKARASLLHQAVPELNDLREVMARIHMQKLNRHLRRRERKHAQVQHHAGILATGKQQANLVKLASHLTDDVDGLIFQVPQVR